MSLEADDRPLRYTGEVGYVQMLFALQVFPANYTATGIVYDLVALYAAVLSSQPLCGLHVNVLVDKTFPQRFVV
jgi:hypothetical protein